MKHIQSLFLIISITFLIQGLKGQIRITGLGDLPGGNFSSSASGVSADGSTVVGTSSSNLEVEAFRWNNGTMEGLGGSFSSVATGVSADGSTVVGHINGSEGTQAIRWEGSTVTGLGDLPGAEFRSNASDVSSDGSTIVGTGKSGPHAAGFEAYVYKNGVMTGLGGLRDDGSQAFAVSDDESTIVGISDGEAFRFKDGKMVGLGDLPGGHFYSKATDVSADGSTVVGYSTAENGSEAFLWKDGVLKGLGELKGGRFQSNASGVSADGSVVVGFSAGENGTEAFLWMDDTGMVSLLDYLKLNDAEGLGSWKELGLATAVSADGSAIVGRGINSLDQYEGFVINGLSLTAVPEPSTIGFVAIFGFAFIALGKRVRRSA